MLLMWQLFLVLLYFGGTCYANTKRGLRLGVHPTSYEPTKGEPWPKPQHVTRYGQLFMVVRPSVFRFEVKIVYALQNFVYYMYGKSSEKIKAFPVF